MVKEKTMKTMLNCSMLGSMLILAPVTAFGQVSGLALQVQANKQAYILGEPVGLRFTVTNRSNSRISLPGGADVQRGSLRVFIAYESDGYKQYIGPKWGTIDIVGGRPTELNPGASLQTEATVLYHHSFPTAHLNQRSAGQITQKYIETVYALARPGTYRIKAVLSVSRSANLVESSPIQIQVSEPRGVDLQVWNVLRNDADYGYFLHTGGPNGHPTSARTRQIVQTLEGIVTSYPTSTYAANIRQSLSSYRASLDRLRRKGIIPPG
jgi:hypothetical protein